MEWVLFAEWAGVPHVILKTRNLTSTGWKSNWKWGGCCGEVYI